MDSSRSSTLSASCTQLIAVLLVRHRRSSMSPSGQVAIRYRHLSILTSVEVIATVVAGADRGVLLAAESRTPVAGHRGPDRAFAQGARRPGAVAADVAGRIARGRGGVRVRPE